MCLIIASPEGQKINPDYIEDAASSNRDGGGLAWLDSKIKKIRWLKGLDAKEVQKQLNKLPDGTPHAVHFRIATVGGVLPALTHPFVIDENATTTLEGTCESLLFHNGGEGDWKKILFQASAASGTRLPAGPWSDSRAVAFAMHVYGPHFLSVLDSHSRYLMFQANPKEEEDQMLIWGDWYRHKDLQFSHKGTRAFYAPVARTETPSRTPVSSPPIIPPTISSRRRTTKHSLRPGHDPWSHFSSTGLSLKAGNEAAAK